MTLLFDFPGCELFLELQPFPHWRLGDHIQYEESIYFIWVTTFSIRTYIQGHRKIVKQYTMHIILNLIFLKNKMILILSCKF